MEEVGFVIQWFKFDECGTCGADAGADIQVFGYECDWFFHMNQLNNLEKFESLWLWSRKSE